tara:strand:- start:2143 stop:2826 length:684 start_codon:yes stop_codon:yes gene_type:complete
MSLVDGIIDLIKYGELKDFDSLTTGYDYLFKNMAFLSELNVILDILFEDRNKDGKFNIEDLKILRNELESGNLLLITKLTKSIMLLLTKFKKIKKDKLSEMTETFLVIVSYGLINKMSLLIKQEINSSNQNYIRTEIAKIIELLNSKVDELQLVHEISQFIYTTLKSTGLWCCGDKVAKYLLLDNEYKVTKEQLKETLTEKRLTIELNKKIDDLSKDLLIKRKELIV